MEQLYLLEVFIEKITIYTEPNDTVPSKEKLILAKIALDPSLEFIIKEDQIAKNDSKPEDENDSDELGPYFTRPVNVGKSILFPSYPDTLLITLDIYPLQIEIWTDNKEEPVELIGTGSMIWDHAFVEMIKETKVRNHKVTPITKKALITLFAECCCKICAKVQVIIRLSPVGNQIASDFQQLFDDPQDFVFRNSMYPSVHQCRKLEKDDKEYKLTEDLYTPIEIEEPPKEICTDMECCNVNVNHSHDETHDETHDKTLDETHDETHIETQDKKIKKYPITKIKIGDIRGPCGNADCEMAQRVKRYIRSLDTYKEVAKEAAKNRPDDTPERKKTKKICGKCDCNDDRYHRDAYEKKTGLEEGTLEICDECGGFTKKGETCRQKVKKICGESDEEEEKPKEEDNKKKE